MQKKIKFLIVAILFIAVNVSVLYNANWARFSHGQLALSHLENLYRQKEYAAYYDSLQKFAAKSVKEISPDLQFKQAYAALKIGKYSAARKLFFRLEKQNYLPLFSRFFGLKCLWHCDSALAIAESEQFVKKHSRHALADSFLIPLAQALYARGKFDKARTYYRRAVKHRVNKDQNVSYRIRAARCLYAQGRKQSAFKEFSTIIKRYPGDASTGRLVDWLERKHPKWYEKNLLDLYPVLRAQGRLVEARVKLEKYIRTHKQSSDVMKARFTLLLNYYAQGRYRTALYGFKKLLPALTDPDLKARCQLYIARSYLALGNTSSSIKHYLAYARKFPHKPLAPEVIWKVAMLYESRGQFEKALSLYDELQKKWAHTELGKEGYFRQGYTLFRLGQYEAAERVFNKIRFGLGSDAQKHRAQYWVALCREWTGDTLTAKRVRRDLAREMWDDYYTLKSYLLEKEYLDSTLQIVEELRQVHNPLHYYGKGFQNHLREFEKVFLLDDLLGPNYAVLELKRLKINRSNLQEWIALAEAYKRLEFYGLAYKTYDRINRRFYKDVSYSQKFFMLKERFPFYYDPIVDKYCRRYGLEKELVLALIKQESAFNHRAVSYANAYGLMQIIPPTARDMARLAGLKRFSVPMLLDPEVNVHLGTLYLKQLHRLYRGDKARILAAYNAGPHRVKRWAKLPFSDQTDFWVENIEFSQTRDYVRHVLKNYWAYKLLYNNFEVDRQTLLAVEKSYLSEILLAGRF